MHAFLSSADFFSKSTFSKNFWNTFRISNSLDPDHARRFVGSDLGPNCLQRLSADGTIRLRVKRICPYTMHIKFSNLGPLGPLTDMLTTRPGDQVIHGLQ